MIKKITHKPILFDKKSFFKNLLNWNLVSHDFCGVDYINGCNTRDYEIELTWMVNNQTFTTFVEVTHNWTIVEDVGDYFTPPSTYVFKEAFNTTITEIINLNTTIEEFLDFNVNEKKDLYNRLALYIQNMLF